eukprot:TRINITY_DN19666_c0_g2_i1.p2 TRINITY_DN19666_c0_g2~~TRINITY_DN19666_c0_g2_i1.p2  ORF type:complete len:100 (-),score=12.09 TRINITY_DN19666_c0_g2_i1:52-351(-)
MLLSLLFFFSGEGQDVTERKKRQTISTSKAHCFRMGGFLPARVHIAGESQCGTCACLFSTCSGKPLCYESAAVQHAEHAGHHAERVLAAAWRPLPCGQA